ncbi:MAG: 2-oxoglutarate and iron-dependent oxygenase domain-containing protein [Myxococcota bacterium]
MPTTGVPLVNLNDFHDPDKRDTFVQQLGDAIQQLGFVRVTGHSLSTETMKAAYASAARFFSMDPSVKGRYLVPGGAGQRGYTPMNAESAKGVDVPDIKEFWHVGRELSASHPLNTVYPPNLWPSELPEFRSVMLSLFDELEACAKILLDGLSLYLEQPESTLTDMAREGNSILRVLHYPALKDAPARPGAVRAAAHEDINLITLLIASTASGLQILTHEGEWMDVNAQPGEIVADSGDMLSRITNTVLPATTHRVINPDDTATNRFSMPFFVHPRPEVNLRVFDNCRRADLPPPAPDITAQGFLDERLAELGLNKL